MFKFRTCVPSTEPTSVVRNHAPLDRDWETIQYSTPLSELSLSNPTTFEATKIVTRIAGTYNVTNDNLQISANRSANDATTAVSAIIQIADADPVIAVTEPAARLISSPAGTDHEITISSDQIVGSVSLAPAASTGTFQGSWVTGDGGETWTRDLRVVDTDIKGVHNWGALSVTNLAGKVVTTITGDDTYTLGGFSERDIFFAAFANESPLGVNVSNVSIVTGKHP